MTKFYQGIEYLIMMNSAKQNNIFIEERIDKLILKFAIPGIISLLVNSIYNIVDQIFIGRGVGLYGTAATNVSFPLVTIALAVALLIGSGGATYYSLKLGAGHRHEAQRIVGNALTLMISSGLILMVLGLLFLEPLLWLFGSTEAVLPFAVDYAGICLLGTPFVVVATGMNNLIRADGSPKYAMFSMMVGAVINTVLDPIFIFNLGLGVKGAAYATIIGQVATCIISFRYLFHFKYIKFSLESMKLKSRVVSNILIFGATSFFTQTAFLLIQIIMNNTLRHYGALSIYGREIPLAVMGIVMKVNQILMAFLIGISIGAQPIVGFNYGAENYGRVREAYKTSVIMATFFAFAGFFIFMLFPENIISVFGLEETLSVTFAVLTFRTFLMFIFTAGFQIITANYFQAIGQPFKAAALSLSRQLFLLVPLLIILPLRFGLMGTLYAGPLADGTAALITGWVVFKEMKRLKGLEEGSNHG